jgi:hypothetical protein
MSDIEREIMQVFRALRSDRQRQLLEYARGLGQRRHDEVEQHGAALLSEHALADWLSDEEDAAWAHLQDHDKADELTAAVPQGIPGRELLRFAGTIPAEDLDEMARVIEEECERTDPDEP